MPETGTETPLDLSLFDDLKPAAPESESARALTVAPSQTALTDPRLTAEPPPPRLVEVAKLNPDELAAAEQAAARLNFRDTASLLSHGDGVLAQIAQASRQLLAGVRLGDAGEIGNIAAAVIDGVKILRIEDLHAEADGGRPGARKGLLGRLLGTVADAHTAFKGFAENRKTFLDLMDQEQAKARKTKADLAVAIELLDQQAVAIRKSLHGLKIEIAAGQIALDRGQAGTRDAAAARRRDQRSGRCRRCDGIPRCARQFPRQDRGNAREPGGLGDADSDHRAKPQGGRNAADEDLQRHAGGDPAPDGGGLSGRGAGRPPARGGGEEKLDEAARQITVLATKGAHDAATSAARSLGGDQRNIDVLAKVADEAIQTMHEVIEIEREVAAGDREREAKLAAIRDRLATGMRA